MTISKELLLAILSMDSYNRGYGSGLEIDTEKVGTADVLIDSEALFKDPTAEPNEASPAQTAGFYAIAYTLTEDAGSSVEGIAPGTTVISYRGTDNPSFTASDVSGGADITNGWVTGGGAWQTDQVRFAQEFFQAATDTQDQEARSGDAILTGHSLGGGLAGLITSPEQTRSAPMPERQAA